MNFFNGTLSIWGRFLLNSSNIQMDTRIMGIHRSKLPVPCRILQHTGYLVPRYQVPSAPGRGVELEYACRRQISVAKRLQRAGSRCYSIY